MVGGTQEGSEHLYSLVVLLDICIIVFLSDVIQK